jgi:predicted O-linked N-acetylglucosamine transferase (SPINDLY family)/glycosyltransferase involved in cell wall biosynthesis
MGVGVVTAATSETRREAVTPDGTQPLVSVICFCKNRVSFIGRSIESVLNQTYRNIEFVVQDGASNDGTLELLQAYAAHDLRVKIVSEPDSGPEEAFWRVVRRCRGEYIATCLSDEELLPDAVQKAVGWFAEAPNVGAITCDGFMTDADGKFTGDYKAGDFDFIAYLFRRYCPFWPGSFFRHQALLDIGIDRPGWNNGCIEFEIWCRLATQHIVKHIPEPVSKYAIHPGQLSNTPVNLRDHIDNRVKMVAKLFSAEGFFGSERFHQNQEKLVSGDDIYGDSWFQEIEAKINQLSQFEVHAGIYKLHDDQAELGRRIQALNATRVALYEHNLLAMQKRDQRFAPHDRKQREIGLLWDALEAILGVPRESPRAPMILQIKLWIQRLLVQRVFVGGERPLQRAIQSAHRLGLSEASSVEFQKFAETTRAIRLAKTHDATARIYESRGQIAEALQMWRRAELLGDRTVDGLASQAALKLPEATCESISRLQQRWADRHIGAGARAPSHAVSTFDGKRKLRIAYHCSFMDADTVRYGLRRAIAAHDRSKFEVLGYSPMPLSDDTRSAFDTVCDTASLDDEAFLQLVRQDRIDVLVELSGFSPGHRFVAMAGRCAPVQVSYLNHFATSRVPNVDYVLSDEICMPIDSDTQKSFSETIYRLPDCLLCYDYTDGDNPAVTDPPSLTKKAVTFGCFASGDRINAQLIGIWADLMHRVPGSIMLIQNHDLDPPDNRRYMQERFRRHGISPDRLILRGDADRADRLKAYGEIDISMDTFPCCAEDIVAESLWQGVPVVTLKGTRFSSRTGASLLSAADCSEFIAHDFKEYVEIATTLALHPECLLPLRHNLRQRFAKGGLSDSSHTARNLEHAYLKMIALQTRREGPGSNQASK